MAGNFRGQGETFRKRSVKEPMESMKNLLLGIDIGTSACKVAVFDKTGKVVASVSKTYDVYYVKDGWVEQDPNQWWDAVVEAIQKMISQYKINPVDIKGVGIDGQSWSAIPIDIGGKVLANTPIWMDTRASDICTRLKDEIGEDEIFQLCGNPVEPMYTTPKILWYKENKPEVYKNTYKILQSNSFIVYRLTNEVSQEMSQGYGLHCFDMRKGIWDEDMCKKLGVDINMLPEKIYKCHEVVGTITKEAAKATSLAEGTPVVAGGLDAACGTLGAGVIHAGQTQEQGGQAGGMSICLEEYKADKKLILSYHVVSDKWLLQGGTVGGGGVIRWFEKEFCELERNNAKDTNGNSFDEMNIEAQEINKGSDGVVFLPYMSGERSPIWDKNAKGVFYGLDFAKTRAHMIRACFEGVAFSLKHNLEVAEQAGAYVDTLYATGGSANSLLWTQIKADITGKKIVVPSSDTSATMGAAMLAGVGVGIYKDFEDAVEKCVNVVREHKPKADNDIYTKNYNTYLELYRNLKDLMAKS